MAFLEKRLDHRVERNAIARMCNRGRKKIYNDSGALNQVFTWAYPLHEFDLTHGLKTLSEFESMRALWMVVSFVPYEGFRMRHMGDYKALTSNTHVVSLGGGSYQLYRRYTYDGVTFDRIITKPNTDALLRDAGGSALTATISTTTGIATSVSGTPVTWTGTFDVPVTFMEQSFPEVLEASPGEPLVLTQPLHLEEIR